MTALTHQLRHPVQEANPTRKNQPAVLTASGIIVKHVGHPRHQNFSARMEERHYHTQNLNVLWK